MFMSNVSQSYVQIMSKNVRAFNNFFKVIASQFIGIKYDRILIIQGLDKNKPTSLLGTSMKLFFLYLHFSFQYSTLISLTNSTGITILILLILLIGLSILVYLSRKHSIQCKRSQVSRK